MPNSAQTIKPSSNTPPSESSGKMPQKLLSKSDLFVNRWQSLLKFNERVLAQTLNTKHPLLERFKFLLIFSSNMDEFFEVRLGPLIKEYKQSELKADVDGLIPSKLIPALKKQCQELVHKEYDILNNTLIPQLAQENILFLRRSSWSEAQRTWLRNFYKEQVEPVLTPIAVDLSHPFPRLINKGLNFIISLEGKDAFGRQLDLAIVPAPRSLPRIIKLPDSLCDKETPNNNYVFLSSIIHDNVESLFPSLSINGFFQFRITRNADVILDEAAVDDLAHALETEIQSSRFGEPVRLEVADNCPDHLVDFLLDNTGLSNEDLYRVQGPVNLARMMDVMATQRPELKDAPIVPRTHGGLLGESIFDKIKEKDYLLHHPYDSFLPVINLVKQAAHDPHVLAIKQTLYRTKKHSELISALCDAAINGKEVTVVIELRARFDEENNIEDARTLQAAGAIVVYGVVGYKTHSKMLMIVRREQKFGKPHIQRYFHLSTGNYHAGTAKLYTDIGLFSANVELGEDVNAVFQELTSMGKAAKTKRLLHAPFTLHKNLIKLIAQEIEHAKNNKPAAIYLKMNSLTEPQLIEKLYEASQAGVKIQLIIRGMCCLRPGIEGISNNIEVRSIIGRFLEHSRVYWFDNDGDNQLYCSSADWMERNLFNRVETCFPILSKKLKKRIFEECFSIALQDNQTAWLMHSDGSYTSVEAALDEPELSLQQALIEKLTA